MSQPTIEQLRAKTIRTATVVRCRGCAGPLLAYVNDAESERENAGQVNALSRQGHKVNRSESLAKNAPAITMGCKCTELVADLLAALEKCERALNNHVQMLHDRQTAFRDPKVFSRPMDLEELALNTYAAAGDALPVARAALAKVRG